MEINNILILLLVGLFILNISDSCENFGRISSSGSSSSGSSNSGRSGLDDFSSAKIHYNKIKDKNVSEWTNYDKTTFYNNLQYQDKYFTIQSIKVRYKYLMTRTHESDIIENEDQIQLINEENIKLENEARAEFEENKEQMLRENKIKFNCSCLNQGELLQGYENRNEQEEEEIQNEINDFHMSKPELDNKSCYEVCNKHHGRDNPKIHKKFCGCYSQRCIDYCYGAGEDAKLIRIIVCSIISVLCIISYLGDAYKKKKFPFNRK